MKQALATALAVICMALFARLAHAADPVRVAFIDPLSGPFARSGESGLRTYEYAARVLVNERGGVLGGRALEIVPYDNRISVSESLLQLKRAIADGIRIVASGNSSSVAHALVDAIDKHNRRNPDARVVYLNHAAVDPALTNEHCSFWHFRFDAHADIKMDALTDVLAADTAIERVYIIGQDIAFGQAVARAATRMIGAKRPDIEIVGNTLHPMGKVKDFTPYATNIRRSQADAVITGNWGADMVALGKAIIDAGIDSPIYTYYAAADGITATFGERGVGRIHHVGEGRMNPPSAEFKAHFDAFKALNPEHDFNQARIFNVVAMLAKALEVAGSDEAFAIASALEGMTLTSLQGSELHMRASDHQMIQDVHISEHTNVGIEVDYDNSGYGLKVVSTVPSAGEAEPTRCDMQRPER